MFRVIYQTTLGLLLLAAGLYLAFVFLQSLADGPAVWAILAAAPIIVSGILLLFRAGKSDDTVVKKTKIPTLGESQPEGVQKGLEDRLEKSNKMSAEWAKTNKARERLRMLELASSPHNEG